MIYSYKLFWSIYGSIFFKSILNNPLGWCFSKVIISQWFYRSFQHFLFVTRKPEQQVLNPVTRFLCLQWGCQRPYTAETFQPYVLTMTFQRAEICPHQAPRPTWNKPSAEFSTYLSLPQSCERLWGHVMSSPWLTKFPQKTFALSRPSTK